MTTEQHEGAFTPTRFQCKACPWRVGVVPERDIPGGYDVEKHAKLSCTIAEPGSFDSTRRMACHESRPGNEIVCVGWATHQLGEGNNLALRVQAVTDTSLHGLITIGPQHARFEDTLPKRRRRR